MCIEKRLKAATALRSLERGRLKLELENPIGEAYSMPLS